MAARKSEPNKKGVSRKKTATPRNRGTSPKSVTGRGKSTPSKRIVRNKDGKGGNPKKVVSKKSKAKITSPARKAVPTKKVVSKRKAASKGKAALAKKVVSKRKAAPAKKAASKRKATKKVVSKRKATKKVVSKRKATKKVVSKRKAAPKKADARKKSGSHSALSSTKSTVYAFKAAMKKRQMAEARVVAQKKRAEALRVEKIEKAKILAAKMDASRNQPMGDLVRPTGIYDEIRLLEESDVSAFPKKTPYSKPELNRLKTALHKERDKLLREISSLMGMSQDALEAARENSGYSLHMAEHATDLQTAETNLAVRSYEEERLEKVEEALDRLENNVNHYGLCLASGRKIGIQRLIAQPHAHLCKELQELYEKIRSRRN